MELKEFIENFAAQFEETESNEITAITIFKDLDEWSSLTALSEIAMADEEYEVVLTGDDIRNSTTVNDLFELKKYLRLLLYLVFHLNYLVL